MLGRKTLAVGAAAAALALTLAACGGSSSSSSGGGSGAAKGGGTGTLTLGVILVPPTLAAAAAGWANESPFHQAVYDTLLHATPDAKPVPWLATSWSYNADKTVLTMKLRDGREVHRRHAVRRRRAAQNLIRFANGMPSPAANKSYLAECQGRQGGGSRHAADHAEGSRTRRLLEYLTQNAGLEESPKAFTRRTTKTTSGRLRPVHPRHRVRR